MLHRRSGRKMADFPFSNQPFLVLYNALPRGPSRCPKMMMMMTSFETSHWTRSRPYNVLLRPALAGGRVSPVIERTSALASRTVEHRVAYRAVPKSGSWFACAARALASNPGIGSMSHAGTLLGIRKVRAGGPAVSSWGCGVWSALQ